MLGYLYWCEICVWYTFFLPDAAIDPAKKKLGLFSGEEVSLSLGYALRAKGRSDTPHPNIQKWSPWERIKRSGSRESKSQDEGQKEKLWWRI